MKKLLIFLSVLAVPFFVVGCSLPAGEKIGASVTNRATKAVTTVYTVGPYASVSLVTTSTSRVWTRITTTSTAAYVAYGGAYTVATRSILSSPLVFDLDHLYTGAIDAMADATTTISVTEFSN